MSVLLAFARQRLPVRVFGPVAALLCAAAIWAGAPAGPPTTAVMAVALCSILLFVVRYRLWDDLADRERDRAAHPDRVVVRHGPGMFHAAGASLLVMHGVLMAAAGTPASLAGLVALELAFAAAYRWRDRLAPVIWRYPVLLAKYPAFVVVTAMAAPTPSVDRLIAASLAVYAGAWVYEARHQPRAEGAWS